MIKTELQIRYLRTKNTTEYENKKLPWNNCVQSKLTSIKIKFCNNKLINLVVSNAITHKAILMSMIVMDFLMITLKWLPNDDDINLLSDWSDPKSSTPYRATYPWRFGAHIEEDKPIRFIGAELEGYCASLHRFPFRQNLWNYELN